MKIVVIESPFAGDVAKNLRYLRSCIRDCLMRGEAPFASHALYTQLGVLDDGDHVDRRLGMNAGFEFKKVAHKTVVYTDLGVTPGMAEGVNVSYELGQEVEYRELGPDWEWQYDGLVRMFATRWPLEIYPA